MIPIISEYTHAFIAKELTKHKVKKVVDIGGRGRFKDRGFNVTDANLKDGINGTCLPFDDNFFDSSVSVATLEHVGSERKQKKFLLESVRVARVVSIHWFPFDKNGKLIENFKTSIGHKHKCIVPKRETIRNCLDKLDIEYWFTPFQSCSEHLLMLASLYPNLNVPELYDFIFKNKSKYLGVMLKIIK